MLLRVSGNVRSKEECPANTDPVASGRPVPARSGATGEALSSTENCGPEKLHFLGRSTDRGSGLTVCWEHRSFRELSRRFRIPG